MKEEESKKIFLADKAVEKNLPIYIHGKAYKPKVPYLDGSYSILIGHYLEDLGHTPAYIDPYTSDNFQPTEPGVFLMAHSASVTYEYIDVMDETDEIYCDIPQGSVIVDPWRKFNSTDLEVIHYGNSRQTV